MLHNEQIKIVVEKSLEDFCKKFIEHPYLSYTEHGLHAAYYHELITRLEEHGIPTSALFRGLEVCIVQKEYRTSGDLGKSRCANWDVSVLNLPLTVSDRFSENECAFDHLNLNCIIEFGLNESIDHLQDDIDRLSHGQCIANGKYIVHLRGYSR